MSYTKPKNNLHRSFAYLDDELVLNSLSAFEAGQVDEVVSKIREAKDNAFGASISAKSYLPVSGNIDAKKGKQIAFEDELIRRRTQFSIFETWLKCLEEQKAIGEMGKPSDWIQNPPEIGNVLRVTGFVQMHEIFSLVRMFNQYSKSTKIPGHPWFIKGDQAREISRTASYFSHVFGAEGEMSLPAFVSDESNSTTQHKISFVLQEKYLLQQNSPIHGEYKVIGQVTEILSTNDWAPTLRLMPLAPKNEFERETVQKMLQSFEESSAKFGVSDVSQMGEFQGPALLIEPIAIYR